MASNRDNTLFEKTSFLQGINSPFIEELYLKYLNDPKNIPQSWKEFFDGLDEDQTVIKKEILGPSWGRKKNNNIKNNIFEEAKTEAKPSTINEKSISQQNYEREKVQSVKAIALIRAYRIRGHLIADLDPLEMMEKNIFRSYIQKIMDLRKKIIIKKYFYIHIWIKVMALLIK